MNQRLALQLEEMETITAPGDAATIAGFGVGVAIGVGILVALT
ncbi:daptide-type RiPP [Paenibacillus xanthanilyticus]|uniref:Daptide-type RiPP n=1 Tax=Paenibacillus xanthanilyticus TaxID=1783531 RepID=A0ABV8JXC8_9BACL